MIATDCNRCASLYRSLRITWLAWVLVALPVFVSAQSNWQDEWEKTLRAAELEAQLTLYGCCYDERRHLSFPLRVDH
jgi:hypothetical protein